MKEFLIYLISLIVDHPEEVMVDEQIFENNNFQYNISANKSDIGKIIGREGKIIQAIRNASKILAVKSNARIRIEIV